MYKEFYGFRYMPFAAAVDGDSNDIHLSKNYEMPLAILVSSLDKGIGLTLVLGANGMGKTTFINYVRKHIEQGFSVGLVKGHIPSIKNLLQQTLTSFGSDVKKKGADKMLRQLSETLSLNLEKQNKQPSLLIIDDADNMTLNVLKGLELLLDLNKENRQLLQVVLVGRYPLRHLLNTPELQGLSIGTQCSLEPLSIEETRSYIDHRLNRAGMAKQKLFDEQSCLAIYECSGGIPGKINSICNQALLRSSAQKIHHVSAVLIHEMLNDSDQVEEQKTAKILVAHYVSSVFKISEDKRERWFSNTVLVAGGLLAGIILVFLFVPERFFSPSEERQVEVPELVESPVAKEAERDKNLQHETSEQAATESQLAIAESHLQALRLTSPKGKNALAIYRSMLEDEPDNQAAHQGIKQIAKKLKELAERELGMGAFDKASRYLQQAAAIHPESEDIRQALIQTKKRGDQIETAIVEKKQVADASAEEKIANLLAMAERQFAAAKLTFPSKDNAYETYTAVLAIVPHEESAFAGLQRVANQYLKLAKKYRTKHNLDKSLRFISLGLKVSPNHNELAVLKKQVDIELRHVQGQQDKIEAMMKKAEQQAAALKLIQPQGDNAYKTYRAILAIDKSNPLAKQGVQRIQQRLKSQILSARDTKDFVTVRKVVKDVLSMPSQEAGDHYLEEAVFAAFETKKIIEDQLENLLALAEQQRKTQRLAQPVGDNAVESYRRVLKIDPANDTAKKGLSSLVGHYLAMVRDAISDDKTDKAIVIANEGLEAFPDHQDLRALRDSVVVQRNAALKPTKEKPAGKKQQKLRPFANF